MGLGRLTCRRAPYWPHSLAWISGNVSRRYHAPGCSEHIASFWDFHRARLESAFQPAFPAKSWGSVHTRRNIWTPGKHEVIGGFFFFHSPFSTCICLFPPQGCLTPASLESGPTAALLRKLRQGVPRAAGVVHQSGVSRGRSEVGSGPRPLPLAPHIASERVH